MLPTSSSKTKCGRTERQIAFVRSRIAILLTAVLSVSACDSFQVERLPSHSLGCDQSVVGVWQQQAQPALLVTEHCKALYLVDAEKQSVERVPSELHFMRMRGQRFVAMKSPDAAAADADPFDRAWVLLRYSTDNKQLRWSIGDVKTAAHEIIDGAISGVVRADDKQTRMLLTGDSKEIAFVLAKRDYFANLGEPLTPATTAQTAQVRAWLAAATQSGN